MTDLAKAAKGRRRRQGIASAAALVWVISAVGFVGVSANAADPGIPGLTDSAKLETPVVATGIALSSTGKPSGAGELVELVAWPPQTVLETLQVGESVKTVPVGYAYTRADGSFHLRVSNAAFVTRYAEPSGLVSFEIRATIGGSPSSFSFVGATAAATDAARAAISAGPEIAVENVSLPATGIALIPVPVTSGRLEPESIPASGLREVNGSVEVPKACVSSLVLNYGPQWVRVGEAYGVVGGKVRFTYSSGASSTLGVGVSASGVTGSFSASGTSSAQAR